MDWNHKKSLGSIFPALAIATLLTATMLFTSTTFEVRAQNVTAGANQTAAAGANQTAAAGANQTAAAGANQTAAAGANQTASQFGNLTAADLEGIRSDLNEARDALHDNLTRQAYNSLGFADNGLFGIANDVGPQNMASFMQKLMPIRDAIEQAKDALAQNDNPGALEQLNTVDVELLKVITMLPRGETEEAEEETPEIEE